MSAMPYWIHKDDVHKLELYKNALISYKKAVEGTLQYCLNRERFDIDTSILDYENASKFCEGFKSAQFMYGSLLSAAEEIRASIRRIDWNYDMSEDLTNYIQYFMGSPLPTSKGAD